ncbi:MAG: response regulator [Bacteroidales bacterium]|nr:response regulator [Bacteroidales bacterium]
MKKISVLLYIFLLFNVLLGAQPSHTFTRYTSEHGLSQKTVRSMCQDNKGLMWFATWDGLYKFDGYTFKNYKAHPGDNVDLNNNRMDLILTDCHGYIWVQNYDGKLFRFDPSSERFESLPFNNVDDVYMMQTGDVWVTTTEGELYHISTDRETLILTTSSFYERYGMDSVGEVRKVYQDNDGYVWILTMNGMYRWRSGDAAPESFFVAPAGESGMSFHDAYESDGTIFFASGRGSVWKWSGGRFSIKEFPTSSSVKFIRHLKNDDLFVGTASDGFFVWSVLNDEVTRFTASRCRGIKSDRIEEVHVDSGSAVWLRHDCPGVTRFDPYTGKASYFVMKDHYGNDITDSRQDMYVLETPDGSVWVHPPGGGFAWYDSNSDSLVPFYDKTRQAGWSSENRVNGLFTDRQGNLWICSNESGLEKVTMNVSRFNLLEIHDNDMGHPGNSVRAVFQDSRGRIWIGTKDKKVRIYDENLSFIGVLSASGKICRDSDEVFGYAYSFEESHDGTVWIGTKGNGLIAAKPAGTSFSMTYYMPDSSDRYSLCGNSVYSIHEDRSHRLWIATYGGGVCYLDLKDTSGVRFISYRNHLKDYPVSRCSRCRFVSSDHDGNIWIGTSTGALMCKGDFVEPEDASFRHFTRIPSDVNSLSNNDVHNIFCSRDSSVFLCTFGGGFNRLEWDGDVAGFTSFGMSDGLPSDIMLSMCEDNEGNLWFVTEEDVIRYEPSTDVLENYPSRSFDGNLYFNEGEAIMARNGMLMFNTDKGLLYFNPDSLRSDDFVPPVVFTSLRQAEQEVVPGPDGIIPTHVDESEVITLPHNRNSFSIGFSALDLRYPETISYSYMLEGFEDNWNDIGTRRTATYTNLPRGEYVLKVRSTNSDGVWVDNVRTIGVKVRPSFWETGWAYLLYVLVTVVVIMIIGRIQFTIYRLQHEVAVEQQVSDMKLRFFTDISHELRTPLTLIAGPVEQVLQKDTLDHDDKEQLVLVDRNAKRMLRLVNQLLDFRKIQNHKMKMRVQQIDLVPFIRNLMTDFSQLSQNNDMPFVLDAVSESVPVWADADKLEKIFYNLISNAFKYSDKGKEIRIDITETDNEVSVSVIDNGVGISEGMQKTLFTRFANLADKNPFGQSSTGIGLYLVKELVNMHSARISVKSAVGVGSEFTVTFLKGKDHFPADTEIILSDSVVSGSPMDAMVSMEDVADTQEAGEDERPLLLVVEDNEELRTFMRSIFVKDFKVIEACNGREGLEQCRMHMPDMVVSDIMMPDMEGTEMVRILKDDMNTSHIPVILLTARSNIESRIEGMEIGADDYITKPFSAAYLKARIVNIMEQRRKLQEKYCASLMNPCNNAGCTDEKEKAPVLSSADRRFMDKVLEVIETNIDNGSLTVDDIASELNMSRSVFFKKLKTITGLSPVEFLRDIRMKRAAELILTGEYTMSQVAYMVGINDSHYFSKCFKQQFGVTPTQYRNEALKA